ncbi:hypothetical protein T484DRAFT_1859918 [Baffinella frigidus]|nr:hypothetical protein T484DRAFT_1859918 [Cryptophyta sp. CCMP2293]
MAQAKARLFKTNPQQEINFLNLLNDVHTMANTISVYSTFAGVSLCLMVFRILKSLDFQVMFGTVVHPRFVFIGYALVGQLLFGHQVSG